MRFTLSAAALSAFVSAVLAQTSGFDAIYTPTKSETVPAGTTYTVTWEYTSAYAGTISIQLLQGASPTTLQLGNVIASGIDNSLGKYSWTVDSSLGADATYGLKIIYDSDTSVFQYSNPFVISAAAAASVATTAAPVTTAAAVNGDSGIEQTIYQTQMVTITSCGAEVTNCPARSTVVSSSLIPIVQTSASEPAPVASSYSTTDAIHGSSSAAAVPSSATPVYPLGNSTVSAPAGTGAPTTSLHTTVASASTTTNAAPTGSSTSVVTGAAPKVAAGSLALFGGLVAAFFAL